MQRMNDNSSVSLPESDYLAILELIQKFHDCRSRADLRNCVQFHLLPFLNSDGAAYGFFDLDFSSKQYSNIRLLDCVGYAESEFDVIAKATPYFETLKAWYIKNNQPIISTDIDFPREAVKSEFKNFLKNHPEHKTSDYATRWESAIAVVDRPDYVVALGVHRLSPNMEVFTYRDVRVLELLHPHLIQSVKTVALNEELKRFKAFVESLAEVPIGMGLIDLDYRVIYQNSAFKQLLSLQPGQRLPKGLSEELRAQTAKFDPPFDLENPNVRLPFYKLPEGIFRLVFTLLNHQEGIEEQCWLLKLKPAVEPFCKMNLLMQENGLTAREMEIASLIRDGMGDQEIGDRLFISIHTVKNHLKNIHQKLNVHTRAKLVAVLNPGKENHLGQ